MLIFGRDRDHVEKRIGHLSQIGGLRCHTLSDGRAAGVRAVDFRTTTGLELTVLLDRGMDISEARYRGKSLCWRSCAGDAAPTYYDARGAEWLWTFSGGMLVTCGLTQVGPPHTDNGEELGLHGRVSAIPADRVNCREYWEEDDLCLEVSGVVREARLFGANLEMHRTVRTRASAAGFEVRDRIVNAGARKTPCMLLYHINTGFPLLDDDAELVLPSVKVEPRDEEAAKDAATWAQLHGPAAGYREKVYFHSMQAASDGHVTCALVNRRLDLGLRLRYRKAELPEFTQWKMLGPREYVLGLEPGNSRPMGRAAEREAGRLVELEVGQEITTGFEIGVVEGEEAIGELRRQASPRT